MIKNINEEMIVDKTVYVPRIVKINNFSMLIHME